MSEDSLGHHISGFVDGEGNFTISIFFQRENRLGYNVHAVFVLGQAEKEVLDIARKVLGCGSVRKLKDYHKDGAKRQTMYELRIQKIGDCYNKLVPFFDKYQLLTKKRNDYLIWKTAVQMIYRGDNLTYGGLRKIRELNNRMQSLRSHKGPCRISGVKPDLAKSSTVKECLEGF